MPAVLPPPPPNRPTPLRRVLGFGLLLLVLTACIPPPDEPAEVAVVLDLNDPSTRRIYDHQNDRRIDSLLAYLTADDPSYRYLAARAFGSFGELPEPVRDSLVARLSDSQPLVREAAAYSLGQSGSPAVADALQTNFDAEGRYPAYGAAIMAALGKTGTAEQLRLLGTARFYTPEDTVLVTGRALSIFYFGRRALFDTAATNQLAELLLNPAYPTPARQVAAAFFQRFDQPISPEREADLRNLLRTTEDAELAMAAARALGRQEAPTARVALVRNLATAVDWRVRVEILRALAGADYATAREAVVERLNDDHPLVARAAANYFVANGTGQDATFYRDLAQDEQLALPVRLTLYQASNRHLPLGFTDYRPRIGYDLQRAFEATDDPYTRADVLRALGEFPWNYRIIADYYTADTRPPVQTAAAEALAGISDRADFQQFFRRSSRRVRFELSTIFRQLLEDGRPGAAYYAAAALQNNAAEYASYYPDLSWLGTARDAQDLPRRIETYRAIDAALTAFSNPSAPAAAPEATPAGTQARPIDWERVAEQGEREVVIRTPEGRVVVELLPELAPATVSAFLELVERQYYDGKVFHRVVPNFVAQGGGPEGDGFGGEAWFIRTETPGLRWDETGLVGIASAGRDTEGVQFFLTHRPVPHLDGNYTIFARIVEGQEIADRLTVGSSIESITLR